MARVTYGPLITELAGSIGGVTFQKNSSGNVARLKSKKPLNPTLAQANQQTLLSQLVAYWSTLSQANKDTWNDLAAAHDHVTPWGETKTLNGYQWFLSANLFCLSAGDSVQDTAPTYASMDPPDAFTMSADAGGLNCVWPGTFSVIPDHLFVYLSLPIRHSSLKLRRPLFLVDVNDTLNASWLDVHTLFEDLAHVNWASFYASADANIICRLITVQADTGLNSSFTSSIIKIS